MLDLKPIEREALLLPTKERAKLANKLLLSLESLSDEEIDEFWYREVMDRAKELDRGEVQSISAEDVRKKALALLR